MASTSTASVTDSTFKFEGVVTIFNLFCSLSLVLLVTDHVKNLPVPEYIFVTIGLVTTIAAFVQGTQIIRKRRHAGKSNPTDLEEVHLRVTESSSRSELVGYNIITSAMSDRLGRYNVNFNDIDNLQSHIDKCARLHKMSGSYLLFLAVAQRIECRLADAALRICPWIIRIGRVRLDFLPADTTPFTYYRDLWLEDIELMGSARLRTRFALMRYADAFGIVYDYGVLALIREKTLSLARYVKLVKADRF